MALTVIRRRRDWQLAVAIAPLVLVACDRDAPAPQVTAAETTPAPVAPPQATPPIVQVAALTLSAVGPTDASEGKLITLTSVAASSTGAQISYAWKQTGAGPRVELKTPYAAATSFKAPEYSKAYELQFELHASAAGAPDTSRSVTVHVDADDDPPTAEAFVPAPSECGDTVTLVGQGRSEESDQPLQFLWMQIGEGPRVQLEDVDRAQAWFVVPDHAGKGSLSFELHVRDGVNPDVIANTHVDFMCDPAFAPMTAGDVRTFPFVDIAGIALPRGKWELTGTLKLVPVDAAQPALATLRFEYGELVAGAVSLAQNGSQAALRMFGLQRDSVQTPWYEPQSSGKQALGDWPANQPLGFAFAWDGRELAVHFGPPGERDKWGESPIPISFPFASRPRKFVSTVEGATSSLSDVQLTGR